MAKKEDEKQPKPQQPESAPKPPLQNVPGGQAGQKKPQPKTKSETEQPASPLMARATPQGQAPAAGEPGKPTMVSGSGGPAAPTMMAGGAQAQPTMIAGGGQGQPTMIASQQGKPTMIGTQQGKPTMIAPPEEMGQAAGTAGTPAAPGTPPAQPPQAGGPGKPTMTPPGAKPTMVSKGAAPPTMLAKAAGKTMVAPPEQQPFDVPEGGAAVDPKSTMLAKAAAKTQVAKTGQATTLAPPGQQGPMPLPEGAPQGTILAKDAAKATMLAKTGTPTTLAPPGEQGPMDLPPGAPKGTVLSRDAARATHLAKTGQPTSLAPADEEPLPLPPGAAKKTSMAPTGHPTMLAPPDEGPMDVPGSQKMTMLARSGEPTTLGPPDEEALPLPPGSKKTGLAPTGQPTTLGPPDEEPLAIPGGKRTMVAQTGSPTILVPEDHMAADAGADLAPSTVDMGQTAASLMDSSTKYQMAPAEKVKPKYGRRWLGGTILGILIGTAVMIGLGLFDIAGFSAPKEWKEALGLYKEPPQVGDKSIADRAQEFLDRGDFKEALEEADKGNSAGPDGLKLTWIKGEARWLQYVREHKELKRSDGAVSKAAEELTQAKKNYARAALWLGKMEQQLGERDKAKELYEEGRKNFPSFAPMFEAAIDEMETAAPSKKKAADSGAMLHRPADALAMDEAEALAILIVAFQAGKEPADAGTKAPDEAGFEFWKALKNVKDNDFDKARANLAEAIKLHEKNRFQRLRKAQNPQSDPTEEIFLRAARDLDVYWQVRKKLHQAYPGRNPVDAVDAAIASAKEPGEQLKSVIKVAQEHLDPDIKGVGDLEKALEKNGPLAKAMKDIKKDLLDQKYINEDSDIADIVKGLRDAVKDAANKLVVKNIEKQLKDAKVQDADNAEKGVSNVIKERDEAYKLIDVSLKMLVDNKYLGEDPKRSDLPTGVERAIDAGRSPLVSALARAAAALGKVTGDTGLFTADAFDLSKQLALAKGQVAILETRLRLVRTPREMMNFWPTVLERKVPKEVLEAAALDARRVLDDKGATANDKGAAHCVQGMVNRGLGNFDGARDELSQAVAAAKQLKEGPWRPYAYNTLRQLTDPNAFFLPYADELIARGQLPEALDVLKDGVAAFPKDGRLLAMRSLAEVEQAVQKSIQAKKRIDPKDPIIDQARKDANAAIAAGALADGNFAAGRVAEELGDRAAAEKHYREALKAHPAEDRAGSRYRVALGRVLLQFTPPRLGPEPGEGNGKKVGMKLDLERQLRLAIEKQDAAALFVLLTVAAVQPEDDLDNDPALDEAIRLGEQAIRAGNPEGYLIKGLALARKGMWTEALQTYTEGLRRTIKPDQGAGLFYIVDHHPAFQLPDALRNPDLAVAEKHYANGLRDYFLGRYPQSEKELLEAYRNNGQDARILYYLGLARLAQQGKRDQAIVNFQMAALLERQQKPGSAAVGAALERVQGAPRRTLETYRP
jgi:hypothetical protein